MTAYRNYDGDFSVRPHLLRLYMTATEDVVNNTSTVNWGLEVYRDASYKPYGSNGTWSVTINGVPYSGTFSYNFNSYSYLLLASGSTVVSHAADGTKAISVAGNAYLGSAAGSASVGGTYTLDTIPRATQPTVSPTSGETGTVFTIGHVPATTTFTHDVAYSVDNGANYTDIVTGLVGTDPSTDWTPPSTLLPNTTSVTALIRVITKSGATTIGSKTVSLPLTVPASVKPTVSSVSWVDAQTSGPDMPTLMGGAGRFVQRWSKLLPTVTSAGAAGSTVVDSDVTIAGQTTDSGVAFGLPVTLSGAVPFTAVVLDSRARLSDTFSSTVAVTAYNFPSLPTPLVTRTSDAAGLIPSPTGTYLAITPAASVSSLNFSGEKNLLEWQVRTRPVSGSWTTKQAWTSATVSGTTWTTKAVFSTYSASTEYEVEVSLRDLFGKNGFDTTNTIKTLSVLLPSEEVFMDYDGNTGVGIGGYRQFGKLHVHGDVYAEDVHADEVFQGVNPVVDFTDLATTSLPGIAELATDAETITGTDTTRTVTSHGAKAGFDSWVTPLTGRVTALELGWVPAIATALSSSGSTATLNTTTGVVTIPAGCTQLRLDGLFQPGYEYEFQLDLSVDGKHTTDNSASIRMREGGVTNTTASFNAAGNWTQFNNTGGFYFANAATIGPIGAVSGNGTYVPFTSTLRMRPWNASGVASGVWFYGFDSFTGGSARGVRAGGYTPPATTAFDGIEFWWNFALTGLAQGKIRVYKRKLQ